MWKLGNISARLEWQRRLWVESKLPDFTWMEFAKLDVESFHIQLRSTFDHVAEAIGLTTSKMGRQYFTLHPQ